MGSMSEGMVIPSMVDGGTWSASFGLSWTAAMLRDQASAEPRIFRQGGQYLRATSGAMGLASARSKLVRQFLATNAEWLFMVDTDMGFGDQIIERLITSAEANQTPVVGALCFSQHPIALTDSPEYARRFQMRPTLYRYTHVEETGEQGFRPIMNYERDAFQLVDGTGAACLVMHREALTAAGPEPFRPILVKAGNPDGTDREFSEDLSFCARLANAGVKIGVDTSIKTSHHKGGIFLDEPGYFREIALSKANPLGLAPEAVHPDLLKAVHE